MKTQQQAAQAYLDSIPRAQTNYRTGVEGSQADWAGRTKSQRAVMLQNLNTSVNDGTWDRGIDRVGNNGWKTRTVAKVPNYGVGLNAGAARQASAIGKIISAEQNIVGSLPPRGTFEQNKARATAVMDQLHALRGTLGAS